MKIRLWSDSTFVTKEIYFEMQWYEKCFAASHLHDALKPPVAKQLCPNELFGKVKCPGGSTVLLKNFVCNVIPPGAPYPLAVSESPRSEDKSPSMQKMHLSCVLIFTKALVQAIYRWIFSAQNTRGQSEQCRIFSASNNDNSNIFYLNTISLQRSWCGRV